ncbi:MAG: hypothetical protein R2932_18860 [Caldilineaceae bacterium]
METPLAELIFVGDTLLNDGQAYRNLRSLSGWAGSCFIGADRMDHEPAAEISEEDFLYNANRWSAMGEWTAWTVDQGLKLDQRTVVIVDIDKTALGAKGRNDQVIDKARIEGIFRTMDSVLGANFDQAAFERQYSELNRARYHSLTADNQDFLAYICLVLNTGIIGFEDLLTQFNNGSLHDFEQFLRWVDSRMMGGGGAWVKPSARCMKRSAPACGLVIRRLSSVSAVRSSRAQRQGWAIWLRMRPYSKSCKKKLH